MILKYKNQDLFFTEVKLSFEDKFTNKFAEYKEKTLKETIQKVRYKKFKSVVLNNYSSYLDWPLGKFLITLKNSNDQFYLNFLYKFGDTEIYLLSTVIYMDKIQIVE